MSDFEVHAIGTTKEIQLSRALAREIEQSIKQFGIVVPHSVMSAYTKLNEHYQWQIEQGAP